MKLWLAWAASTAIASAFLWTTLSSGAPERRTMFVPGTTTEGHHQIEGRCEACHTPFEGVTNDACLSCHGAELTAADDSHPPSKFRDPRNAGLLTRLDAMRCVTCHREHTPDVVRPMGVTMPDDYCVTCHADIGAERPSHAGMTFDTCATAGCHNYHDNTALYEDFLRAHADKPALSAHPRVRPRTTRATMRARGAAEVKALERLPSDAPAHAAPPEHVAMWETTSHAKAGVNCTACHAGTAEDSKASWIARPSAKPCESCHAPEVAGFGAGRHGMRAAAGLPPMTPALARIPMRPEAHGRELSCSSCHTAHAFDTRTAAVEACVGCHDDRHTRAYNGSPHHALWVAETSGAAAPGSGVSCATCHLPRETHRLNGADVVSVQHNQNATLRPNEKMLRSVCLDCHGLGFSIDALADPSLIQTNFTGRPVRSVAAIEMAMKRSSKPSH